MVHENKYLTVEKQDSFEDLLKQAQNAQESPQARPGTQGGGRRKRAGAIQNQNSSEIDEERLGDDFEETPWLAPSIEKAKEFKNASIFRSGDIRLDSIDLINAPDLGSGVTLYFQFAMTMALCLFIMSLLSLPSLIFIYNGAGILESDQDAFGLYRYTLGNMGVNKESNNYASQSRCTTGSYSNTNQTCIHFSGHEISVTDASGVMTAMEVLQLAVFFIGVMHLHRKVYSVQSKQAKTETSVSDYAIIVRGIPKDVTEEEIIAHFNGLYQLSSPDYKGRPAVEEAVPVKNSDFSNDPKVVGTWIAECIIHKGIGSFISSFKDKQHLMEKLYRCRAQMKMYAENSEHAGGHNLPRFLKAEQHMMATGSLIDTLTEKNLKQKGLKILASAVEEDEEGLTTVGKTNENRSNIYKYIDAPSIAAFIIFNYSESFARCIEDYEKYQSFPHSLFYPHDLKIRGHKIVVMQAPEPDQIVWENLEVSKAKKNWLRGRTAFITFLLVAMCFIVILQASIFKNSLGDEIPSGKVCKQYLPKIYSNNHASWIDNMDIETPENAEERLIKDQQCHEYIAGTFYAEYQNKENDDFTITYDIKACNSSVTGINTNANAQYPNGYGGICPIEKQTTFCPCISTKKKDSCCSHDVCPNYKPFKASDIGSCYCYAKLTNIISTSGVVNSLNKFNELGGPCTDFFQKYSLVAGLTYFAIIVTTGVNAFLRFFLKKLAKQEAHTSIDKEQGSIMSKVFMSNYATMAVIILIAYGSANKTPPFFHAVHVFDGPYTDFNNAWYGNVGFYLMTTFILQSFTPVLAHLLDYYVMKPLSRSYHHKKVLSRTSHSIVMQHDLNMLEVGPVFDSTTHTAQLLTLLFFAMTFAPGLPLLMPLCCFTFVLYFRVDKLLLCRFYQKPPQIGDGALKLVLNYLPYAALIRLSFAIWMFSVNDILPDNLDSAVETPLNAWLQDRRHQNDVPGSLEGVKMRILRPNVFPLFVLLCILVGVKLIRKIWKQLPVYWIMKLLTYCASNMFQKDLYANVNEEGKIHPWDIMKHGDLLRQEIAPYTDEYYKFIKHKDEIPDTCLQMFSYDYLTKLTELEVEEGWQIKDRGDFVIRMKIWQEVHRASDGRQLKRGDAKKTYEIIADHRCNTFNIEKVPAYKMAMKGLREGTTSMMESQNFIKKTQNVNTPTAANIFANTDNNTKSVLKDYNRAAFFSDNVTHEELVDKVKKQLEREALDQDKKDKIKQKPSSTTHKSKNSQVTPINMDSIDVEAQTPAVTTKSGSTSHSHAKHVSYSGDNYDTIELTHPKHKKHAEDNNNNSNSDHPDSSTHKKHKKDKKHKKKHEEDNAPPAFSNDVNDEWYYNPNAEEEYINDPNFNEGISGLV